jgi:3-oxoacyl-[acyl-carrier-protein] synthase III
MFINSIAHYLPHHILTNAHFNRHYGFYEEDIVSRSGILERRKALTKENTNTMALEAVKEAISGLPFPVEEVDLIIGATYTPYDTVGTLAHSIQEQYKIPNARTFSISSACSSMCNAIEIADSFFKTGKAGKAIIVASEHNTGNVDEGDKTGGFLWGDGAVAMFISKQKYSDQDLEILDVTTSGLGHVGKSIHAVFLRPNDGGIKMPLGRDVFQFACKYLELEARQILEKNGLTLSDMNYLVPHQANLRIIDYVRQSMGLSTEQVIVNVDKLGNTGCASAGIGLSQYYRSFREGDIIVVTVFGGGYSSGAVLLKK